MAKQSLLKNTKRQRREGPQTGRANANTNPRKPRYPFLPPQAQSYNHHTRQTRPFQGRQSRPYKHGAHPRRRRHFDPTLHNLRPRPRTNNPPPHLLASASSSQTPETESPPPWTPSNRCSRCNSPHLASIHRDLKNQGTALQSDLGRLIAALEALQPDTAEMDWVSDHRTVFYQPRPWHAAAGERNSQRAQSVSSSTEDVGRAALQATRLARGPAPNSLVAQAPAQPQEQTLVAAETQMPDSNVCAPYCLDSWLSPTELEHAATRGLTG